METELEGGILLFIANTSHSFYLQYSVVKTHTQAERVSIIRLLAEVRLWNLRVLSFIVYVCQGTVMGLDGPS